MGPPAQVHPLASPRAVNRPIPGLLPAASVGGVRDEALGHVGGPQPQTIRIQLTWVTEKLTKTTSHSVTLSFLLIPRKKPTPNPESSLFECVYRFCYFYFFFSPKNYRFQQKKKFKLLSKPASPKTPVGLELHSISHRCVCNVHGKGKRLSLTFQEAEPLPPLNGACSLWSKVTSSSPCAHQNEGGPSTEI